MVRRFIKIFDRPHYLYWSLIPLILISAFVNTNEAEFLDINVHDTYFVIATFHLFILASCFFAFLGLVYYFLIRCKIVLNTWLNLTHTLITVLGVLLFLFPIDIFPTPQPEGFPEMPPDFNTEILITLIIVSVVQVVLLLNIGVSFTKNKKAEV